MWAFGVEGDPTLHEVGDSAIKGEKIHAYITTRAISDHAPEARVFNLSYNANSGILKHLTFTNTEGGDPSTGIINSFILQGLQEMEITYVEPEEPPTSTTTTTTTTTTTQSSTTSEEATPSWLIALVIVTFTITSIFRKRKFKQDSS